MNASIEIRKTPDGRIQARRLDGLPLTPEDQEEAKRLAQEPCPPCLICGAAMTETKDIYGKEWWACWGCAVTV